MQLMIEKEVDALGRVVIPKDFRRLMGIEPNSKVFISLENDTLVVSTRKTRCALCSGLLEFERDIRLCDKCIALVKSR